MTVCYHQAWRLGCKHECRLQAAGLHVQTYCMQPIERGSGSMFNYGESRGKFDIWRFLIEYGKFDTWRFSLDIFNIHLNLIEIRLDCWFEPDVFNLIFILVQRRRARNQFPSSKVSVRFINRNGLMNSLIRFTIWIGRWLKSTWERFFFISKKSIKN